MFQLQDLDLFLQKKKITKKIHIEKKKEKSLKKPKKNNTNYKKSYKLEFYIKKEKIIKIPAEAIQLKYMGQGGTNIQGYVKNRLFGILKQRSVKNGLMEKLNRSTFNAAECKNKVIMIKTNFKEDTIELKFQNPINSCIDTQNILSNYKIFDKKDIKKIRIENIHSQGIYLRLLL